MSTEISTLEQVEVAAAAGIGGQLVQAAVRLLRRGTDGRFQRGTAPGPGRPATPPEQATLPAAIALLEVDQWRQAKEWYQHIIDTVGVEAFQAIIQELECDGSRISYRHVALQLIAGAGCSTTNDFRSVADVERGSK